MEGGRGKNRQVILVDTELLAFPPVWERLGVQLRVVEHLLKFGVVERTVAGGVDVVLRRRGGWSGKWGGVKGGTGWGGRAYCLGGRRRLTSCRETFMGGRGGCGVSSGSGGASRGGCCCYAR